MKNPITSCVCVGVADHNLRIYVVEEYIIF